ncbi:membrane protein [Lysinibacillus sp. PLM2]|nr:membrane protein [Lysinibacillus sp. PLM2]
MRYTKAFFIKLVMTVAVLWVVLGLFFNVSFGDILIISALLTVIAFVGDIFILPLIGNIGAAVGDFILAFLGVWVLGSFLFNDNVPVLSASLLSALFIAAGELYFHRYLRNHVFEGVDRPSNYTRVNNLQTEFSEEFDADLDKEKET